MIRFGQIQRPPYLALVVSTGSSGEWECKVYGNHMCEHGGSLGVVVLRHYESGKRKIGYIGWINFLDVETGGMTFADDPRIWNDGKTTPFTSPHSRAGGRMHVRIRTKTTTPLIRRLRPPRHTRTGTP